MRIEISFSTNSLPENRKIKLANQLMQCVCVCEDLTHKVV
jgi:hypothetical protein